MVNDREESKRCWINPIVVLDIRFNIVSLNNDGSKLQHAITNSSNVDISVSLHFSNIQAMPAIQKEGIT